MGLASCLAFAEHGVAGRVLHVATVRPAATGLRWYAWYVSIVALPPLWTDWMVAPGGLGTSVESTADYRTPATPGEQKKPLISQGLSVMGRVGVEPTTR